MVFFYKPLKVEINVYPSVFSAKNPVTGKHLSVRRKGFGRLSSLTLSLQKWSDCLRFAIAGKKKRELKLSSHIILFRLNNQLKMVKVVTQSELSKDS